ncbi:MAG: ribonuclease P protein component [Rhodocyclaceae bacterium]|nr:ribonuclease P protein component [Rhodocyclaceae bacterium]
MAEPACTESAGRNRFSADFRLRKTDEYSSVFAFRRALRGRFFTLHYRPSEAGSARLGLIVAKRLARRAVQRNLLKRLAREAFRLRRTSLPEFDMIVRLTSPAKDASRRDLRDDLDNLLGRLRR